MATDELERYIWWHNGHRVVTHHPNAAPIKLETLTQEQCQELIETIEDDLSPENLSWDGARPNEQVEEAANYLNTVLSQVKSMAQTLR